MTDFSSNIAVLKRFSEQCPGHPLPTDFRSWTATHTTLATQLKARDPELVALLDGSASAGLVAAALGGEFSPVAPAVGEAKKKATSQRVAELASRDDLNLTEEMELMSLNSTHYAEWKRRQAKNALQQSDPHQEANEGRRQRARIESRNR